jgi:hypothetical protein
MDVALYTNTELQTDYVMRDDTNNVKPQEHMYHSTEYKDQNNDNVYNDGDKILVLKNDGAVNYEELFTLYLQLTNPIAVETIQIP